MAEITAAAVGKLREMTNAGMMDCKKALTEANGDINVAVDILRKKGAATAAAKSSRGSRELAVRTVDLMQSELGPGGSRYSVLAAVPLHARGT